MTYSETHEQDFINAFGRALLSWQNIEVQLFFLFKALIRATDDRVTSAAFHAITSFQTRLTMINEATQIALADTPLLQEWKPLCERIRERSSKRNQLAHLTVSAHTSGDKTKLILTPSVFDVRDAKYLEYDVSEIRDFESSFRQLAEDIDSFLVKVANILA